MQDLGPSYFFRSIAAVAGRSLGHALNSHAAGWFLVLLSLGLFAPMRVVQQMGARPSPGPGVGSGGKNEDDRTMSSEKNIGVGRKSGNGGSPVERRDFLKTIGLAGTAAAAAIPLAATGAAAEEPPEERVKPRYQETDHVKLFYALNRL